MGGYERMRAERDRLVAAAEKRDGVRERHHMLNGVFVRVWLEFYPKQHWLICECRRPRGEDIEGTTRALTDQDKAALQSWL